MEEEWLSKYSPKETNDLLCDQRIVTFIKQWLSDFKKNKQINFSKNKGKTKRIKISINDGDLSCSDNEKVSEKKTSKQYKPNLLVQGSHGIGKSSAINVIIKECDYEVNVINFSFKNSKNVKDILNGILYGRNIINMINGNKKHIVLVIDEVESISSQTEKKFITSLIKYNDTCYFFPIIFISNTKHNKIISDIKKKSVVLRFPDPTLTDIYKLGKHISNIESIIYDNDNTYEQIIYYSQNDIRKLIIVLADIKKIFGSKITCSNVDSYLNSIIKKDVETELYDTTRDILFYYKDIDTCFKSYNTEKVLLPLMVQQNYINILNRKNNLSDICQISDLLSCGDIIENNIYSEQNWDIQDIHGLYTCVYPCFILDNIKKKNSQKIEFTTDLNKTSIKNINKKNIICVSKYLKNSNIYDVMYISKIIKKLIDKKQFDKCVEIFKIYGIKMDGYESLLKIDKIDNSKAILTYKQKRELMAQLNQ